MSEDPDEKTDDAAAAPSPADEEEAGPDAIFEALWKRALEGWDDDKPHAAVLTYALENERLPDLAGRYRKLLEDADKGPRAKKKIDGIVVAATQLMMATKTPMREKLPWQWTASVAAVFVLVVSFLAYKILLHH